MRPRMRTPCFGDRSAWVVRFVSVAGTPSVRAQWRPGTPQQAGTFSARTVWEAKQPRPPTRGALHASISRRTTVTAARGRSGRLFPDQGWTVFHLPPTSGVVPAVGSATSGKIREEDVKPLRRMGLKAQVAAQ